jgi:hypothetical protein
MVLLRCKIDLACYIRKVITSGMALPGSKAYEMASEMQVNHKNCLLLPQKGCTPISA